MEKNYKGGIESKFDLGKGNHGLYQWAEGNTQNSRSYGNMLSPGREAGFPFFSQISNGQGLYRGNQGRPCMGNQAIDILLKQLLVAYLINDIMTNQPIAQEGRC